MKAIEFITQLRSQGRYSFTIEEAERALGHSKIVTLNALKRLKNNIVSPARGFYLVLPPEYQMLGCLPAEMFVHNLMGYFQQPYYVGFLSAAQYYGAAHQKPQAFQIVTLKNRRPIHCGRIYLEFIAKKSVTQTTIKKFNTPTGTILVASPEELAIDLVIAPQHAAGINNLVTVLLELAESIQPNVLIEKIRLDADLFWAQRLGYLFDELGLKHIANPIFEKIKEKKLYWVKLIPQTPYTALSRNARWKIVVNTEVEPDE